MSRRNRRKTQKNRAAWRFASWVGRTTLDAVKHVFVDSRERISRFADCAGANLQAGSVEGNLLRPRLLANFIGQEQARANLSVFIAAARRRKEPLDHLLL